MVVVEPARGLDGKKRTRTRTADICDKEEGKRKALVIMGLLMAKMLQKP